MGQLYLYTTEHCPPFLLIFQRDKAITRIKYVETQSQNGELTSTLHIWYTYGLSGKCNDFLWLL